MLYKNERQNSKNGSAHLESLDVLSINTLRERDYDSTLVLETLLDGPCVDSEKVSSIPDKTGTYKSYMASYMSDGLRVYSRINIPDGPPPREGFPVIIFAHGWVGEKAALDYMLGCDPASMYAEITDAYARAGYIVFIPGYRGHATVNGIPGDGIEYLSAWDNGTYLSTQFYAIDVLNLMGGLSGKLESDLLPGVVTYDRDRLNLGGHSQGGDVVLTVLAATGEGAKNNLGVETGIIWSGAIADRKTQMQTFFPLQSTPEAFLSGDGTWTGTARGKDGTINPNFIFGYPPEWIETPDVSKWTWQEETWKYPDVKSAMKDRLTEIYDRFNSQLDDISNAGFSLTVDNEGKVDIVHDQRLAAGLQNIGGFAFEDYLQEKIMLHFPDRDYISLPSWNYDLCQRVNRGGGNCTTFEYPQNNHGMRISQHEWFAGQGAVDGYATMVARDIAFFRNEDPATLTFPYPGLKE